MTNQVKKYIKENLPFYGKITSKGRYTGVKDKAWAILSDYVRIRDWLKWKVCVTCGKVIEDYTLCDAGHFISMGGHGALSGFSDENIHGQCKHCNQQSSFHLGVDFEKTIILRGYDINKIKQLSNISIKADDWFFIKIIETTYKKFQELKEEYPDENYPKYL